MSYGNQYNTRRTSNRSSYNTPGQFVPASEPNPPTQQTQQTQLQSSVFPNTVKLTSQLNNLHTIQTTDVEMKQEVKEPAAATPTTAGAEGRPAWMKPKLAGVKKVSNKERRKRQNATLRRLLTPKNALMVLNEMCCTEQMGSQYTVEQAGQYAPQHYGKHPAFVAELKLQGQAYQGYGDTKMAARNAAAEQAIRDLVLKKMEKDGQAAAAAAAAGAAADANGAGDAAAAGEDEGEDDQLPMLQLASFALHKLFSEWEFDGHRVPQLKPPKISESGGDEAMVSPSVRRSRSGGAPGVPGVPTPKTTLPEGAATMHPAMLLTYMRPGVVYRELAVEGDRPQNLLFTMGVDVDGHTYTGKAGSKKEARKNAARSACEVLFKIQFIETKA